MTLWFAIALMTAAAVFAVLWPLGRRRAAGPGGGEAAVYRDQLDEIGRDRASGLIGEAEAEAARVEVSRRLIAAAEAEHPAAPEADGGATRRRRAVAAVALVVVPAIALGLYLRLGSPALPDQPLALRLTQPPEKRSIESLVAQVEAHLAREPRDGRGWELLAPVYMRLGRFDEAANARRLVIELSGSTADREADFGEALVAAANSIVTAEAKAAFERAARHDKAHAKARFFLGIAAEQDGKRDEAAAIWRALIAESPADAPWLDFVRQSLARVSGGEIAGDKGPSADVAAAAGDLSPEQQTEMARSMVARLAERMKQDGADVEGWLRLVRAYTVLGERDKARAAVTDARRALAAEPDKLQRLDELAKGLGLEG